MHEQVTCCEYAAACLHSPHAHASALTCTWGESVLLAGGKSSGALLDCAASAGRLVMPVEASVAHGDANLAFDDFLKNL